MIRRRPFLLKLLGTFATAFVSGNVLAQSGRHHPATTASPQSADKKEQTARLRLWKATDAPQAPASIRLLPTGKPASAALTPLKADATEFQFGDYVEVPAGPLEAEVSVPGQPAITLPMNLAGASSSTLLVRFQGGKLTAEWIDDTPGPTEGECELSIYSLLPAIDNIDIAIGPFLDVHLSTVRSSLRLSGIKPALYSIVMSGTAKPGRPINWNADLNFTQYRRATLLIYTDPYDRIRPRLNTL